jgi:hypothetical protein
MWNYLTLAVRCDSHHRPFIRNDKTNSAILTNQNWPRRRQMLTATTGFVLKPEQIMMQNPKAPVVSPSAAKTAK